MYTFFAHTISKFQINQLTNEKKYMNIYIYILCKHMYVYNIFVAYNQCYSFVRSFSLWTTAIIQICFVTKTSIKNANFLDEHFVKLIQWNSVYLMYKKRYHFWRIGMTYTYNNPNIEKDTLIDPYKFTSIKMLCTINIFIC